MIIENDYLFTESLIEAVKSRAGIWDTTDETYHNRLKKKQMWIDIMDELSILYLQFCELPIIFKKNFRFKK